MLADRKDEVGPVDADRSSARRPAALRLAGLFLILLLVCAAVVALHVDRNPALSVLDEFAYADYLHKIDDGHWLVRHGEVSGQEALRDLACRGYAPSTWNDRPPCDAPSYDPEVFPNAGIDSADIHPPTYFLVTYAGARLVRAVGLQDDLIDAGRLFGAVWMAAGLLALWCLVRTLGAGLAASAAGLALVASGPMLLQQWHYLTPDAANVLVGALVMLGVVRWERSGRGWAVLVAVGALAMAVKAPNVVVVVAGAGYLLVRALLRSHGTTDAGLRSAREYLSATAALVGGAAATSLVWLVVRAATALPGTTPMEEAERTGFLHPAQVIENLARFVTPWDREPSSLYPLAVITSYLFVGSLLVVLATVPRRDRRYALALVVGVVLLVGPLLLVAANFLVRGTYAIVEPRYGTTLVPVECAIAASLWSGRSLVAVGALAVFAPAAVLLRLLA
ncbi:MAG: glycosyltransferase family 39 protein [Actinomycetota bacterium]|nr:glycosyltransferase family 39 protein [Actinomycetota bacterium]